MARKITKVKHLEMELQEIEKFDNPKIELEQYMTSPGQAAHTLMAIESQWGDIVERSVADLGCGTGMLSIGASILGADYVLGVEKDSEAMEICKYNIDNHDYDLSSIDLMAMDVVQLHRHLNFYKEKHSDREVSEKQAVVSNLYKKFDTVIMNPPFGTKDESHGIDMIFLETAVAMATCAVYSFHLTSTTRYIKKKAKELDTKVEVVDSIDFSLPKTYKFHKKKRDTTEFKTTKSKKRKIVDKENALPQPSTKKQKSSNASTSPKQVIKQGSKNKRNKYKNFSKVKEVEFTDKQSEKGSSNERGKEKNVNRREGDKLNKKNDKKKQAGDADKENSANLRKKNKRKREESVSTEKHEGAGVKKRKRKRSEKLAVNGLGESSKETKDSISNGETKKKKNKKKDSSAKKSEKVVKGDGQSTGSETGTEGVTGEVKKKKRRKKKKKPSSKKNKYKHLDEARKAAREAVQEGTINALENNSSSISKADEKRSVDNSEIKVTSHQISGKKGKVKLNKGKDKETKKEKHSKRSDLVPVESSTSSTEENVKSVEKGLIGKKMKKRKMEYEESKNSSNDRTEKSSCVSTNTGPILASVDGVGATGKRKNNKKRKGKEVGESGVTHLSDNLSAVTKSNNDQGKKSPKTTFNLKKLGEILQNSESKAQEGKGEKQHGKKKKQKLETENSTEDSNKSEKLSINEKQNRKENKEMTLKERMTNQLKAARFRYLNEKLYTQSGDLAMEMFKKDRESYMVYHEGFQTQVAKWPTNPVDVIIEELKKCNPRTVIADFGCGDAKIARSLPLKIHSFDLVAINKYVTACNMAKVPLSNSTVDVAVFCLSLMGTNLKDYLTEANRVLKKNGTMKVAEVSSRFNSVPRFLLTVEKFGFKLTSQDDSNKMFIMLNFKKTGLPKTGAPDFKLHPCVYKKR